MPLQSPTRVQTANRLRFLPGGTGGRVQSANHLTLWRGGNGPTGPNALTGITWLFLSGLRYLDSGGAWALSRRAVVKVEKGFGSGIFQKLYPASSGQLFTLPNGRGQSATVFAAGAKLMVETPYNQALADEAAAGHPSPISAAHRVILDLAKPTCPRYRGLVGAQDAGQDATLRGYDLNISFTYADALSIWSVDRTVTGDQYIYQTGTGAEPYLRCQAAPARHYPSPGVAVALLTPATTPTVRGVAHTNFDNQPSTSRMVTCYNAGGFWEYAQNAKSNTPISGLRWMGPGTSLSDYAYGLAISKAADLGEASYLLPGVPADLARLAAGDFAADELAVVSPSIYTVFDMDLVTHLADMEIHVLSGPGRAIEANWNGSGYVTLGTTDSRGVLVGTLPARSVGSGNLVVRVVGQATTITIGNIAVGIVLGLIGQSNAQGRGDDITGLTATLWSENHAVFGATKKWAAQLAQKFSTAHANCVVQIVGYQQGSTTLAPTGYVGHWNKASTGAPAQNLYNLAVNAFRQGKNKPKYILWHQGENDALDGATKAGYQAGLSGLITNLQGDVSALRNSKLVVVSIGRNDPVPLADSFAVRLAQQDRWDNDANIIAGGCLAFLPTTDEGSQNVHFTTNAQKQAVCDLVYRHLQGAGRAPKISSGSIAGARITLTFAGGVAPLTASNGEKAAPIGWTVSDDSGALTVTSMTVAGLAVTLVCNRSIVGPAVVKWGYDPSGIGSTLVDSDATYPLWPEVFQLQAPTTDLILQSSDANWYWVRVAGAGPYTIAVDQAAAAIPAPLPAASRVLIADDGLHYLFSLSTNAGVTTVTVAQVSTGAAGVASISMNAPDGTAHLLTLVNNAGVITYTLSQ